MRPGGAADELPARVPQTQPPDLNRYGATLAEHYEFADAFVRLRIREQSPLVGTPHDALSLSAYEGLRLIVVQRGLVPPTVRWRCGPPRPARP